MRNRALKLVGTPMYEAVVQAVQGGVPPQMLPRIPEEYHAQYVCIAYHVSVLVSSPCCCTLLHRLPPEAIPLLGTQCPDTVPAMQPVPSLPQVRH